MAEGYTHVKVRVSGVIPTNIDAVWSLVRVFSSVGQWMIVEGFVSMHSELLPGHLEGQIGSCRILTIDGKSFVEQLEGLDDIKHTMRWKVISHPDAVNPWPYAFLNFQAFCELKPISLTDETYFEYQTSFDTERLGVDEMEASLRGQLEGGIRGLQRIFHKPPTIGLAPAKPSSMGALIGATQEPAYKAQAASLYMPPHPAPHPAQQAGYHPGTQQGYHPGFPHGNPSSGHPGAMHPQGGHQGGFASSASQGGLSQASDGFAQGQQGPPRGRLPTRGSDQSLTDYATQNQRSGGSLEPLPSEPSKQHDSQGSDAPSDLVSPPPARAAPVRTGRVAPHSSGYSSS